MPLTSFAVAFSLGRAPSQPDPAPRPQSVATASDHSNGSLRRFSDALRLGKVAEQTPVQVAPQPTAPARPVVVPEWLSESVKIRPHGVNRALTGKASESDLVTKPDRESSPLDDEHETVGKQAVGEPAASDRPRDSSREYGEPRESNSDVARKTRTELAARTSAALGSAPLGDAHAPAEGPGARYPGQDQTPTIQPATVWTIRTNDGLAYQGPDKAALEIWAAARNAELARVQTQWSYPASYQPWSGYGYASGGCSGGSCR